MTNALAHGRFTVNVCLFGDVRDTSFVSHLVGNGVLAFPRAALGLLSVLLLRIQEGL